MDETMNNVTSELRAGTQELHDQIDGFKKEIQQLTEAQKMLSRMAARSAHEGGRGGATGTEDQISAVSLFSESDKDSEGFDSDASKVEGRGSGSGKDFVFKKTHSKQKRHVS